MRPSSLAFILLAACHGKDEPPADTGLEVGVEYLSYDCLTEPLAFNHLCPRFDVCAWSDPPGVALDVGWESEAGELVPWFSTNTSELPLVQGADEEEAQRDGTLIFEDLQVPEGLTPGAWGVRVYDARDEHVLYGTPFELDVGPWGYLEADQVDALLAQPIPPATGRARFHAPAVGPVVLEQIDVEPVFIVTAQDGRDLEWELVMWREAWADEGRPVGCRLTHGSAAVDDRGRFAGLEPALEATVSSGDHFYVFDQHVEGGLGPDGAVGGVRLDGQVDFTLFEQWSDDRICGLLAGFGDDCVPCDADPERLCLDVSFDLREPAAFDRHEVLGVDFAELPWCSTSDEQIPDFDLGSGIECSGCAAGGGTSGGAAGLALLGLLFARRRR